MTHFVISSSYGNDSVALIQWVHEAGLLAAGARVTVTYCDTGWAAPNWPARVERGEAFARSLGFEVKRIESMGFAELARMKKGFPGTGPTQFCTAHLKGIPFLQWIDDDDVDPNRQAIIMVGKRRAESEKRKNTPEFVPVSEYHGDRMLTHPLYAHTDEDRNALLARAGFEVLPHRSQECNPCVYANRGDFMSLSASEIEKVASLEVELGRPMFRPKRFGAVGIYGVMVWAKYGRTGARADVEDVLEDEGCGAPMGCGL